jgi:hypothetical protein
LRRRCSCRFACTCLRHITPCGNTTRTSSITPDASELWHTRLATRAANGEARQLSADNRIGLRAIWSPADKPGGPMPSPGASGLSRLPTVAPMDIADDLVEWLNDFLARNLSLWICRLPRLRLVTIGGTRLQRHV